MSCRKFIRQIIRSIIQKQVLFTDIRKYFFYLFFCSFTVHKKHHLFSLHFAKNLKLFQLLFSIQTSNQNTINFGHLKKFKFLRRASHVLQPLIKKGTAITNLVKKKEKRSLFSSSKISARMKINFFFVCLFFFCINKYRGTETDIFDDEKG